MHCQTPATSERIAKDIAAMFKYWSARSSEPVSSSSFAASAQRGQVILNHGHAGTFARLDMLIQIGFVADSIRTLALLAIVVFLRESTFSAWAKSP